MTLLNAVLKENRRWQKHHAEDVLRDMTLTNGTGVSIAVSKATGGLTFEHMMALAEKAELRKTLTTIADEAVNVFEKVLIH